VYGDGKNIRSWSEVNFLLADESYRRSLLRGTISHAT
jgi:hypothetical protein